MDSRNGLRTAIVGLHNRGALMSKNKPKETIEYVIRMQDREREMLDSLIGAYQFNRVMEPIVKLMNDVTGMAVFLSIVAATGLAGTTFVLKITTGGELTLEGLLESFWVQRMEAHEKQRAETGATGPAAGQTGTAFWTGIWYNLMNPNWSWFGPPPQQS